MGQTHDNAHMNPETIITENAGASAIPAVDEGAAISNAEEVQPKVTDVQSEPSPASQNGPPEGHPRWDEVISQKNDWKQKAEESSAELARMKWEQAQSAQATPPTQPSQASAVAPANSGPFDPETAKALNDFLMQHPMMQQMSGQLAASNIKSRHPELSDPAFEQEFYGMVEKLQAENFQGDVMTGLVIDKMNQSRKAQNAQEISAGVAARMDENEQIKAQSATPHTGGQGLPTPAEPDRPLTTEEILQNMNNVLAEASADGRM